MTMLTQLYKTLFGKSYQEVWRQFARANNGAFICAKDCNNDSVEILYQDFKITFDTYTHLIVVRSKSSEFEYTRVRVELLLPDNLNLKLFRQGFIESIGKLFGMQDITIGDKEFDKVFIVKGNNDSKIQQLFSNATILNLILSQKDIRLEILDTIGFFDEKIQDGISVLYLVSEDKIKTIEQLNSLYRLYAELLNQLTKLSSAKPGSLSN